MMWIEDGYILCIWMIFIIVFALYLRYGLESAMIHHEGTLVSASRTACPTTGSGSRTACPYHVTERFLYDNNTRHCTVTRSHVFYKKSIANHAVKKVELGTTRTIWLKPGTPHTCFDEDIIHYNFVVSMVMISLAALPSCYVCSMFCEYASSKCHRSAAAETGGIETRVNNKHTPVPAIAELGHGGGEDDDGLEMRIVVGSTPDVDIDIDLNAPSNRDLDLVGADQVAVVV